MTVIFWKGETRYLRAGRVLIQEAIEATKLLFTLHIVKDGDEAIGFLEPIANRADAAGVLGSAWKRPMYLADGFRRV